MTPPRDSHPFGWLMTAVVVVLAAAGFVGLLVTAPVVAGWLASLAVTGVACWWVPNRGLRAELEEARRLHSAMSSSSVREELADVGPVTGPTNVVELFDGAQLAEWSESGFRPQRPWMQCDNCDHLAAFTWSDNGVPHAACEMCVELWWPDGIDLGVVTDLRLDGPRRQALNEWSERLAALPGCVWESCPHPDRCTDECRWPLAEAVDDDTASTLPRSLPGRER